MAGKLFERPVGNVVCNYARGGYEKRKANTAGCSADKMQIRHFGNTTGKPWLLRSGVGDDDASEFLLVQEAFSDT